MNKINIDEYEELNKVLSDTRYNKDFFLEYVKLLDEYDPIIFDIGYIQGFIEALNILGIQMQEMSDGSIAVRPLMVE